MNPSYVGKFPALPQKSQLVVSNRDARSFAIHHLCFGVLNGKRQPLQQCWTQARGSKAEGRGLRRCQEQQPVW